MQVVSIPLLYKKKEGIIYCSHLYEVYMLKISRRINFFSSTLFQVSLLLGTIIRKVPLPISDVSESGSQVVHGTVLSNTTSGTMLDVKQLEVIGNHFLEVLLKMKHNGAIDKTRAGFTALCNRLLCSNDARYLYWILLYRQSYFLYAHVVFCRNSSAKAVSSICTLV